MTFSWYHQWIGRYLFRKLTIGIALTMLTVFLLLGYFIHDNFYRTLAEREQELLDIRTERFANYVDEAVQKFKQTSSLFYYAATDTDNTASHFYTGADEKPDKSLEDRNYFSALASELLNQNAVARDFYVFRAHDRRLFHKSRTASAPPFGEQVSASFFERFPKTYAFPFTGKLSVQSDATNDTFFYLASPVFNYVQLRDDKVIGYYMMVFEKQDLLQHFFTNAKFEGRVAIAKDGDVLLDSSPGEALPPADDKRYLHHRIRLTQNGLEAVALENKSAIRQKLTAFNYFIVVSLSAAWLASIVLISNLQTSVIGRFRKLSLQFKKVEQNPFVAPLSVTKEDEIGDLMHRFNRMTVQLQDNINRVYVTDMQKRNAEYYALKMQINPHFLYNTLESLRMAALVNNQHAIGEKLYRLGHLFRWMLDGKQDVITAEEELEYVAYYIDLFTLGKTVPVRLELASDTDLAACLIPKFILQPIIENALIHGKLEEAEDPVVAISFRREPSQLTIDVCNNGMGIEAAQLQRLHDRLLHQDPFREQHLGLKNVHERIRSLYGEPFGVAIVPSPPSAGFTVRLTIPIRQEENDRYDEHAHRR